MRTLKNGKIIFESNVELENYIKEKYDNNNYHERIFGPVISQMGFSYMWKMYMGSGGAV